MPAGQWQRRKCILRLKQAQIEDPEEFREMFVDCLHRALLVFKRELAVERFVTLVTSCVSFSNERCAREGGRIFIASV